ncbi:MULTISPECIES: ATP-binding cassette domain-containing protein [Pseudarthrobacter]|uniref:ATP-binding cassette domain-containing protein n=1 Tax=Pseudarthrobacter TaxID=1742993 RepID=UPI001FCA9B50|nr:MULTISPECIES: ABC transporter ATP-binding protein [Pseudarthrobacter]MDP9998669.1 peptide/nickel transport system ATP-binding protein [Pseudarthrobacter sulfonivorans]
MSATRNSRLVVDGLEVSHREPDGGAQGSPLLSGVSLSVDPGEFVALVGSSGSGKTLTAMSSLRLLPPQLAITGGSIRLGGLDLTKASESELNSVRGGRLGMLFQQPKRMFNPNRTIEQHLKEPLRLHAGLRGAKARAKALELLAEVGFADPAKGVRAYPHQLSGGMAQRAMTALALAGEPEILLADEPTSALDKVLERQVLQLLDRERRERGLGVLYITHNIASVASYADRVLVMNAGSIVEAGPAHELLTRPRTAYAQELLAAARLAPETRRRPPSTEREVLVLDRVGKRFGPRRRKTGHTALTDVSLTLKRGEILGVLGQSGSGKSTLARTIVGLEAASTGSIIRQLEASSGDTTAVQLVFQEPHSAFDPRMTLRTSLQAPLRKRPGLSPQQREARITGAMDEVELDRSLLDKRPGQCSGGQLQRATIARALLLEPQIVICDEATSALDALTQRTILSLLLRLQRERDLSLIVISHDMDVVRYMCDRVAVLLHGRVIEVAETGMFFAAPRHPHSQALVSAAIPCRADGLWTVLDAGEPARAPRLPVAGGLGATAGPSPAPTPGRS